MEESFVLHARQTVHVDTSHGPMQNVFAVTAYQSKAADFVLLPVPDQ